MKKRTVIALVALIVCACALLTGCQSSKAPRVEYVILGLELKNNTGKAITECYIYDAGSDELYGNLVDFIDGAGGMWLSGKNAPSPKGFVIRPASDIYKVKVVYLDGTQMVVSGLDLLLPDAEGQLPNEIALIDDAMGVRAKFNEDPEVQLAIDDAIFMGATMDGWYPPKK
jgi:hypothetical protein